MKKPLLFLPLWVSLFMAQFLNAQTYCSPTLTAGLFINSVDFSASSDIVAPKSYTSTFTTGYYTQNVGTSSGTIQRNMSAYILSTLSNTSTTASFPAFSVSYKVFADWNKDGDFTDAGEDVFTGTNYSDIAAKAGTRNGYAAFSISFTIPASAPTGNVRLRFALRQSGGAATPCGGYAGETEDYIINVQGNTAPVLNTAATPLLNSITEAQTNNEGLTITQLLNSSLPAAIITDADYKNAAAPYGIAVTAATAANGHWEYKLPSGSWTAFSAVSTSAALLLQSDMATRIRFVPGTPGTASFSFKAWDLTTGANGQYGNTTISGGTAAFSSATITASIVVAGAAALPPTRIFFVSAALDQVVAGSIDKITGSVYTPSPIIKSTPNLATPTDLAYDPESKKLFWTESTTTDKVVSANADGSGVTVLVSSGMNKPAGIAVGSGKIFVSDNGSKAIYRVAQDGSGFTQITGGAGQSPAPATIKDIEFYRNHIYFIAFPAGGSEWKIMKTAMDGTSPEELFSTPAEPAGLSVANGVIYWTEDDYGICYLKSGPATGGGGPGTLLLEAPDRTFRDLEADATNNKLYIIDVKGYSPDNADRTLWTSSLDGTGLARTLTFDDTYSNFALQTAPVSTLPVRLLRFGAEQQGPAVSLAWQTGMEKASSHFIVERSTDGKGFYPIGRVEASGLLQGSTYGFFDRSPLNGTSYYRLKQVDTDGSFTLSSICRVTIQANKIEVKLYPNPVTGNTVTVELNGVPEKSVSYQLVNSAGFTVKTGTLQEREEKIQLSGLPGGIYILQLSSGETAKIEKK